MIRYVIWDVGRISSIAFVGAARVCRHIAAMDGKCFLCTEHDARVLADFAHVYGLERYVDDRICGADGIAPAPAPEAYNLLIGVHELPPDQVLLVSEREEAIMAGRRAGIRTCRLRSGARPDIGADWTVTDCLDLCEQLWEENASTETSYREPRYSFRVGEMVRYPEGMLQPEPAR